MILKRIKYKKVLKYLLISIFVLILMNIIYSYISKTEIKNIYTNKAYTIGVLYDIGNAGRGTTLASYKFRAKNITYKGAISLATFDNSNPRIGKNYIVVYNSKNPSDNICFLNLEIHDSIKNYFKKDSLSQHPIEEYQRTIDSFFFKSLTGGINKYFPPYYKKEDFPELEYLWKVK
ncbi:hypothetical protein SAMN05444278_11030 [Psychroflexus salarius]|uniref:Uncharacterized protein n=1 Tax=Psychroflexus salarius TaxID=1155689 RepID=A0A1M4XRD9_9FLAO|nr:hypothetical protein [Psychroflexus salarius]SHE96137.1 hypothetical protein SAMN05444278_11030 [Psychroflexus salarius]